MLHTTYTERCENRKGIIIMANDELRIKAVEVAKKHKSSWIELGQYLFSIFKNKLYKEWGYQVFETYCKKELGIKDATASKLIKSYSFLEKEEPRIVKPDFTREEEPRKIPDYEAVNLLRLAKNNKNIPVNEFAELRHDVLNEGKECKEVREQVKKILEVHKPQEGAEAKEKKRSGVLKRLIGFLNSARNQLEEEDLVPDHVLKQIENLAQKLADQLE